MAGPLDLSPFKPVVDADGDAEQIAGGFTTLEQWGNGGIPLGSLDPTGAAPGQVVGFNGTQWVPVAMQGPIIYRFAPVTIVNSNALTTLFSQSVPGGVLGTNQKLRVALLGDHLNNTGVGQTLQVQVLWGGTTVFDHTSGGVGTAATRGLFWLRFELYAAGDAGHQAIGNGEFKYAQGLATTTGLKDFNDAGVKFGSNGTLAVDSTVAQILTVKAKLQNANAALDVRMLQGSAEVV